MPETLCCSDTAVGKRVARNGGGSTHLLAGPRMHRLQRSLQGPPSMAPAEHSSDAFEPPARFGSALQQRLHREGLPKELPALCPGCSLALTEALLRQPAESLLPHHL